MKFLKWLGSIAAGLVLLAGLGYLFREPLALHVPGMILAMKNPVGPNVPVAWSAGPDSPPAGDRPPNIVVILADDLGINDVGFTGGEVAPTTATPNIDALASQGVRFSRAYAGNAVCSPSRAAIMTGRYPNRFGFEFRAVPAMQRITALLSDDDNRRRSIFNPDQSAEGPSFREYGVPASEVTMAEMLKSRGYHTVHIGKWHLGSQGDKTAHQQGFDEALTLSGLAYLPEDHPDVVNARQEFDPIDRFIWANLSYAVYFNDQERFAPEGYITDYFTREAITAIERNRNRPFFLHLAHWAVHNPLQALKSDYEALAHIEDHRKRVYAAMIRALDRSVGQVMQALRDNGLADNTLVIFTSDNGGAGYIGLPEINAPFRGWKATNFEGGLRVPFAMHWPRRLQPLRNEMDRVSHLDIFRTVAVATGASEPTDRTMDSINLLPFATNSAGGPIDRPLFWKQGDYATVIADGWKLQRAKRPDKIWLFNLTDDPTEQINLVDSRPGKRDELSALLDAHLAELPPPLKPTSGAMPVTIDKSLREPESDADEYVYFPY